MPVGPPSTCLPRGATHGRPRGPVRVASCHASAPPALRAGHPCSATWPPCHIATRGGPARHVNLRSPRQPPDVSFSCVVKTQRRWSNKIYKIKLTKTRSNNQVLGKYRVDPQRAVLTLIVEWTSSNLGLKGVLKKRK